jgi:hypothetical protein
MAEKMTTRLNPKITLDSIGCGSIRMSKQFITKENLERLFQLKDPIVVDKETADEITNLDGLLPSKIYLVASEKDLDEMDEEEANNAPSANPTPEMMQKEEQRRNRFLRMEEERKKFIAENYHKLHKGLYEFNEKVSILINVLTKPYQDILLSQFSEAIKSGNRETIVKLFKKETETGIYSFEMFSEKFCK